MINPRMEFRNEDIGFAAGYFFARELKSGGKMVGNVVEKQFLNKKGPQ